MTQRRPMTLTQKILYAHAITSPGVISVGRSLWLCTAMSTSRSSSARSISAVKNALPSTFESGTLSIRSPRVLSTRMSTFAHARSSSDLT